MSSRTEATLIPWDPLSEPHRALLVKQRVECSWDMEMVQEIWRDEQIRGDKCIYWIVLPVDELVGGGERETLMDTAASISATPRQPTQAEFIPVGHIALDSNNKKAEKVDLGIGSEKVFWVKNFFVRHAFQSNGIGRAAMDEIERIAVREPLCAKTLMLDTVEREDQLREEFAKATYGRVPKIPNQDWYRSRGYGCLKIVQNYYDVPDKNGKIWDTKTVFMRKDLQ
ncbi:hypothetical protein BO82DRAFT_380849 [Aspergillus uvarum CBS 121591]|uniref:N-acetyltransferase domain-containing protein n=1 Tax=Aspergillus uvarum CBS 121591 TaxID=1448315 RepID=A0A319D2F6_9EURO|nr:hypothetical protein BO82DRAFT_380849 [Aspergillus uvarum CBS 121591]PYH85243.1 hypothetical protein BO82DRAFT_380849 [Aspergillus uvarum CBS 121591]